MCVCCLVLTIPAEGPLWSNSGTILQNAYILSQTDMAGHCRAPILPVIPWVSSYHPRWGLHRLVREMMGHTGVFTLYTGFYLQPTISFQIKSLTIDQTKWCMQKRYKTIRWYTSRSPIFDTTKIHQSAMKKERRIGDFCISSIALRWKFIISQIWEREVNQRMILHLFRIHHFVIWLVVEFSMRNDIVGSGWKFENPCTYHFPWIVTLRLEAGRLPGRGGSNLVSAFANACDQIWSRIGALMGE